MAQTCLRRPDPWTPRETTCPPGPRPSGRQASQTTKKTPRHLGSWQDPGHWLLARGGPARGPGTHPQPPPPGILRPLYREKRFPDDRPCQGPKGRYPVTNPLETIKNGQNSANQEFSGKFPEKTDFFRKNREKTTPPRPVFSPSEKPEKNRKKSHFFSVGSFGRAPRNFPKIQKSGGVDLAPFFCPTWPSGRPHFPASGRTLAGPWILTPRWPPDRPPEALRLAPWQTPEIRQKPHFSPKTAYLAQKPPQTRKTAPNPKI